MYKRQELKRRPVAQLLSGLTEALPAIPEQQSTVVVEIRRPGPFGIECPVCQAAMGRPCRVEIGERRRELRTPHAARIRVANGGPAHLESETEIERRRAASAARLASLVDKEALGE